MNLTITKCFTDSALNRYFFRGHIFQFLVRCVFFSPCQNCVVILWTFIFIFDRIFSLEKRTCSLDRCFNTAPRIIFCGIIFTNVNVLENKTSPGVDNVKPNICIWSTKCVYPDGGFLIMMM